MIGADEFAPMFSTDQYGRLYIVSHHHARGRTFRIFVLPAGAAELPGEINGPRNPDAVEVYGITGGHPGWTETYGWLHKGPWQDDFYKMVSRRHAEIKEAMDLKVDTESQADRNEKACVEFLLSQYTTEYQVEAVLDDPGAAGRIAADVGVGDE